MRVAQYIRMGTATAPAQVIREIVWPTGDAVRADLIRLAVRDDKWTAEAEAVRIMDGDVEIDLYTFFDYQKELGARREAENAKRIQERKQKEGL